MNEQKFPILEFDDISEPVVSAKKYVPEFAPNTIDRCLITYFTDVVEMYERVFKANQVFKIRTEGVRPCVFVMNAGSFKKPIFIVPMPIGAPQAARVVEALCATGVKKFIVCGGAGTLNHKITQDKVLIPIRAVRDEGTSYHYLPPSREIEIDPKVLRVIETVLKGEKEEFEHVKTWTTDGIFRETADKVRQRIKEGCSVVEMECSAFYAVGKHKGVSIGQLLYAGDIVATDNWDYRDWHTQYGKREKLFELAIKCLLEL
jgi:uridine phosphorylase